MRKQLDARRGCAWVTTLVGFGLAVGCGAAPTATAPAKDAAAPPLQVASEETEEPAVQAIELAENSDRRSTWVGAASETSEVLPGLREHRVAVWVDVPKTRREQHVPVALTLTVDTSGSMQGAKIQHARAAAKTVVRELDDGDVVAVHTFSDDAEPRVRPTKLSLETRPQIQRVLGSLHANGGTNLFDAVRLAAAETWRVPASHPVKRVVVISDGQATVGPTSAHQIGRLAEVGASRGVQVTSLGVGLDYDEQTLNELAKRSSGRLYHLADSRELSSIVKRELRLMQDTRAVASFVELVPAQGAHIVGIDGVPAMRSGDGFRVPLGALHGGQTRELVVRVQANVGLENTRALVAARLHFADPLDGAPRVQESLVRVSATHDADAVLASGDPRAQSIIALQTASQIASRAADNANRGELGQADLELAAAERELQRGAAHATGKQKERMLANAQRMKRARDAVKKAKAKPAPARKRASRATALEMNDAAMDFAGY